MSRVVAIDFAGFCVYEFETREEATAFVATGAALGFPMFHVTIDGDLVDPDALNLPENPSDDEFRDISLAHEASEEVYAEVEAELLAELAEAQAA